jgi:hypothetical protein
MQASLANSQVAMPQFPMMMPVIMVPVPYAYALSQYPMQQQISDDQGMQCTMPQPIVNMTKQNARKLRNRTLVKKVAVASSGSGLRASSSAVAALETSVKQRLLRLALAALSDAPHLVGKSVHQGNEDDSVSMTTRTTTCDDDAASMTRTFSYLDDTSTVVDADLMADGSFLGSSAVEEPRIGIDIGGVLTYEKRGELFEVPGSVDAVRLIVEKFGETNVFIVSKVRLGGRMHKMSRAWLNGPNGFLKRVGLPAENVDFVEEVSGRNGKGVTASRLGLSFFVDDTGEVLESVFADEEGNSFNFIEQFDGTLFHFSSNGQYRWKSSHRKNMSAQFWSHYRAVSGWPQILEVLGLATWASSPKIEETWMLERQRQSHSNPSMAGRSSLVHHVGVEIEDDASFGLVERLLGLEDINFRFIADETGAKLILNGKGSPHPQARRFEQEPLTICIRAKTSESLEKAVEYVEDLLHDVRVEYQQFNEA